LTAFEKTQARDVFVGAGRLSFHAFVPIENNPYKDEPFRSLWEKGWRTARRQWNDKRFRAQRAKANQNEKKEAITTPANANRNADSVLRPRLAGGPFRRYEGNRSSRSANRSDGQRNAAAYRTGVGH
jgi:hypothetical protein